jgi:hypothetical protein
MIFVNHRELCQPEADAPLAQKLLFFVSRYNCWMLDAAKSLNRGIPILFIGTLPI